MEGTRGAVKNRFSFVSLLSASVAVTESGTAAVKSPQSQNILCRKNENWRLDISLFSGVRSRGLLLLLRCD